MERRAAAYARYSTDNQTENSIAYQMHEITGYCAKNNIRLTHSFIDEGQSGTNMNRVGFQNMLTAAKAKEFDTIVVYDVSRGSRDISDWFAFRKQMQELGIKVISCHQQLGDPLNPDDFLREFITVGLGHHMVLETRQKSMDGMSAAAREGKFLGGIPPFGYAIEKQRYVIVPSEAAMVRQAFQLYSEGYSYNYIMDKLQLAKVKGRYGTHMNKNSLYYMFKNPRYAGVYIWNEYTYQVMRKYVGRKPNERKVEINGAIPAIVTMEVWLTVQERLKNNIGQNRRITPNTKRIFLLSGLIKCQRCGGTYTAYMSRSKGKEYVYYRCNNRYGKKRLANACQSEAIRGDKLETFVIQSIKDSLAEHTDFRQLAEYIAEKFKNTKIVDTNDDEHELESIKAQINNAVKAIVKGFNAVELQDEIEQLKMRKKILEDTILKAKQTNRQEINVDTLAELLQENIKNLDNADPATVQAIIRAHVPFILAMEDGSFTIPVGYILPDGRNKKINYTIKGNELIFTDNTVEDSDNEEKVVGKVAKLPISPSEKSGVVGLVEAPLKTNTPKSPENGQSKTPPDTTPSGVEGVVAGAVGLEPTTNGFGDHYSTN